MDFGVFGFTPEQAEGFRAFMANQQAQGHQGTPGFPFTFGAATANANNASATAGSANQQQDQSDFGGASNFGGIGGGDQQEEEPVLMHNAHHNGVVCDICNTEIRGFRYKCLQCADYDLCSKCEHKGHHAGHIMMRIAFPEQARDAIRRYVNNSSCPPSPPTPPRHGPGPHGPGHHGPHHGQGPHVPPGMEGLPFLFRRGSHCHRRRGGHGHGHGHGHGNVPDQDQNQSSGAEDNERPATAPGGPGCPYQMGKKEFKRWSKWMKRAAAHQHRSAEAYARAAAASGTNADPPAAGAENVPAENPLPMDFAAVASQIQEFLNYWGVPVDVVELYDQFGNRGQPGAAGAPVAQPSGENQASTPGATGQGTNATTGNAEANNTSGTQAQQPTGASAAAAENLSDNMQQMRLDETQAQQITTTNNIIAAAAAAPPNESLLMDLDAENSGWTIVNSREQSPGNNVTAPAQQPAAPTAPSAPQVTTQQAPVSSPSTPSSGSMNSNNGNTTPFASAGSVNSIGQPAAIPTTTPTAPPPTFPTGVPNVPLYPVLNQPQLQQILQNVSSAVNSVVRSIPIVTDPRGPMGTNLTSATNGQVPSTGPASATSPTESLQGELDARSMKTLNQLLAMGFSNEGGYLTRLVVAKKGDLEAVLSSLFPN